MKLTKIIVAFTCLFLIPNVAFADTLPDIHGHWGEKEVKQWINQGFISGYSDGTFKPNREITRSEFVTIVNKALGLKEKNDDNYSDVKQSDWYHNELAKAKYAGYISGYTDGTVKPRNNISRQEAVVIIANLLRLTKASDLSAVKSFKDSQNIPEWSRACINEMVEKGYSNGYKDKTFRPTAPITRAEAVVLLNKALGEIITEAKTYGPVSGKETINGNLTLTIQDITLQNLTIEGDLYCTAGIGQGNVYVKNSEIKGNIIISGGGINSIIFQNTSSQNVIVYKNNGTVRVVSQGSTSLNKAVLETPAILVEQNATGNGFSNVEIKIIKPGETVEIEGTFEDVSVTSKVAIDITGNTNVKNIQISKQAEGSLVNLESRASISSITLNAGAEVKGSGKITTAVVNANNVSIQQQVSRVTVSESVQSTSVGGKEISEPGVVTTPQNTSSSGGSSTPANHSPEANDDFIETDEDISVLAPVFDNDTDSDGDELSLIEFTNGQNGIVNEEVNGLRYSPSENWYGTDSFTYKISDGRGGETTAAVSVSVYSVNDNPVTGNDTASVDEDSTVLIDMAANDTDIDGDTLSITGFTQGAHGAVAQEGDSLRYTPAANYYGADSFTYNISDGNGGTATGTVNVTINPVNDLPVANNETPSVNEDSTVLVDVIVNNTDAEGDTLSIASFTQGTHGVVAQEGDSLRYTPAANYNGADSFTYNIGDGNGGTATGTVNVTINPVNDLPMAANNNATLNEDSTVLLDVLVNDTDIDGDTLSITSFTQGAHGVVAQEGDSLRFTPAANYYGADSFTYNISDGNGGVAAATVNVTINPVNDLPVANNETSSVNEDSTVLVDVIVNDTDAEGDTLSIASFTQGTHGVVAQEGDSLRYTPAANYNGADSFTYNIGDGNGGTATGTVNVTINPVNDLPVANNETSSVNEDSTVLVDVLVNDTDAEGDTLSIASFTQGTHGVVVQEGDSLRYTPAANYNGADSFTYNIGDGNGGTATGTVNVTINPVNDLPVANNETPSVNEDSTVLVDVLVNDTDAEGDTLSIASFTQGTHGVVVQEGDSLRYTPATNYNGADSFLYEIHDGNGGVTTATVNVTINPVNDLPVAANNNATLNEDSTVLLDVLVNDTDADGDTLSITGFTQGTHGAVVQEGDSLRYTPAANYNGADSFLYEIHDGNGGVTTATVNVTINPVNDLPVAANNNATLNEDSTVLLDVLVNDTDIDGDTLSITGFTQGTHGVVAQEGDSLRYTPAANYNGADSFLYEIHDGNGGVTTATVNVTINSVNDAPVTINDSTVLDQDATVLINIMANDTDVEGNTLAIVSVTQGSHGMVSIEGVQIRYTPDAGYSGPDSFTYTISDSNGGTSTATVNVTVTQPIVLSMDIDNASGSTGFIPLNITIAGTYEFKTSFYMVDCDTVILLYDASQIMIANNDDYVDLYACIIMNLDPGTYYLKVEELSLSHLYSHLEVTRL